MDLSFNINKVGTFNAKQKEAYQKYQGLEAEAGFRVNYAKQRDDTVVDKILGKGVVEFDEFIPHGNQTGESTVELNYNEKTGAPKKLIDSTKFTWQPFSPSGGPIEGKPAGRTTLKLEEGEKTKKMTKENEVIYLSGEKTFQKQEAILFKETGMVIYSEK